jgi:hypothetical protein
MNVILHPADAQRWTFQISAGPGKVGMQATAQRFVGEEGLTVLGGEDQV